MGKRRANTGKMVMERGGNKGRISLQKKRSSMEIHLKTASFFLNGEEINWINEAKRKI